VLTRRRRLIRAPLAFILILACGIRYVRISTARQQPSSHVPLLYPLFSRVAFPATDWQLLLTEQPRMATTWRVRCEPLHGACIHPPAYGSARAPLCRRHQQLHRAKGVRRRAGRGSWRQSRGRLQALPVSLCLCICCCQQPIPRAQRNGSTAIQSSPPGARRAGACWTPAASGGLVPAPAGSVCRLCSSYRGDLDRVDCRCPQRSCARGRRDCAAHRGQAPRG
jgi:hypothetical protein